MGKLKIGAMGTNIGKIGNTVSYPLNGEIITRMIGVRTGSSVLQNEVQERTALLNEFKKPIDEFIRIGLKINPKRKKGWSWYNDFMSINNPQAIAGIYPDLEINYEKIVLAKGNIPVPLNSKVTLNNSILNFSWEADLEIKGTDEGDQIMCIAYFPEILQAFTVLSGAKRGAEEQTIQLPSFTRKMVIETYMCFISDDRKRISNSLYTGQLIWDKK